jgi:hypothetical protein
MSTAAQLQTPEEARPYFFFSYAHSGDDRDVFEFFDLLCQHLRQFTTIPADESPGYLYNRQQLGTPWHAGLRRALAHCRVFVPLYSPRYFQSRWCGQEWDAFDRRQDVLRQQGEYAFSAIVPVLWVGSHGLRLPSCARRLQYDNSWLGSRYRELGVYGLKHEDQSLYRQVSYRLARAIQTVAEGTNLAICPLSLFKGPRNAFEVDDPAQPGTEDLDFDQRDEEEA